MRIKKIHIIFYVLFIGIISFAFISKDTTPIIFKVPQNWPKPNYDFTKNPLTEEGFQLGRNLFYDPILSRDNTISCASCHLQATGFTHTDHDLSHGIDGKIGQRNSLALMNLAWQKNFMWDGGVNHLDVQPLAPITNHLEMDENLEHVVKKLNASVYYKTLFKSAFQDSTITGQKMLLAFSQFLVQLNSFNSKYDRVIRKEKGVEFTEQEKRGLALFRKNCANCHKEPLFTSETFENIGLKVDTTLNDLGRMAITKNTNDSLKFKIPTLRNIQFTFPYMHDGRFKKLSEVVNHYVGGIQNSKTLSEKLKGKPILLSHEEKIDVVVFLLTLTDTEFLFNKRFTYPLEQKNK